ncbi:isoflavone reductase family protein [Ilyonectria robusta]
MATSIKNVALLGATDSLGAYIFRALVDANFTVLVIQRKESTKPAPRGSQSIKVDLTSKDELVDALKGQDAVISTSPNPSLLSEKPLIDAAISSNIKRLILSEYSTNIDNPKCAILPILANKVAVRAYVNSLIPSASSTTTWSSVNNDPLFDTLFPFGILGPNLKTKTATFHDGGERIVCTSRHKDIAAAVAKSLSPEHYAETANHPIYIYSAAISEKILTDVAAKVTGIDFGSVEGGQIKDVDIEELRAQADELTSKGDKSAWFDYYYSVMYGKGYGGDFRLKAWNEKLGIKPMSQSELAECVEEIAKEMGVL